ncbi:helix-turn-helix transcriptional regulator [Lentilactobacillus diolivorans]|jgi:putative transcriptional regulator|uniref:HTH cro/C1-type domain-containing protein n=2 Tax=Lentilactobacillus diolivorans TaxID=179838 RepID=A0A0R1SCX6_9LACO|nr:helix-turn-helix transcriptional regulator [Lentilactobacillus diolivorans]KRL67149.1 hypothetical protein FC85_GL002747 [Lentilactobacillus diolivorans DSM 14421]GEP24121.1 hypothetical protein LDI01_17140 [Lentilactobacillus diolivorans]
MSNKHNKDLQKARKRAGYTQRQMADKLGIQPSSYQRYESGTRLPQLPVAFEISSILNVPPTTLFNSSTSDTDVYSNDKEVIK